MKPVSRQIEIIKKALSIYTVIGGMFSMPLEQMKEICEVRESINLILEIDPAVELAEAIQRLNKLAKMNLENKPADDSAAILGYYEKQMKGGVL